MIRRVTARVVLWHGCPRLAVGRVLLAVTVPLAACLPVLTKAGAQEWAVEEADARIRLSVEGDLYAREKPELSTTLDFNALLGYRKVLAADSLKLVEVESRETVAVELAEDAELRHASGNPVLRLTWTSRPMGTLEGRAWDLYFRTVPRGSQQAWQPLEKTFLSSDPSVLWDTSFEEADPERDDRPAGMYPGGWDKEGETTERVWTDEEARTGEHALKIARTFHDEPPANSNRPHWRSWPPRMPVRPGQTVRASGWLKTLELGERSSAGMMLEFYDAENKRLREGMVRLGGRQIPHDWTEVTATTTAPNHAANAVVWFSLYNEGVAYCDDVLVTTAAGAALPELEVRVGEVIRRAAAARPGKGLSEDKGFLEPRNFGRLVLPYDPTVNSVTGRPLTGDVAYWGRGALAFEVTNRRDGPVDVQVLVTREEDGAQGEGKATVGAGGTIVVDVPMAFHAAGEARVRYDLLERPDGKLLYTAAVTHAVPEPLTLEPDHLISYLSERMLTGRWSVGLSEAGLAESRLALEIARADSEVVASATVTPENTAGGYAVEIADLTEGRYQLNATLTQRGQQVGRRAIEFDRMAGPFGGGHVCREIGLPPSNRNL